MLHTRQHKRCRDAALWAVSFAGNQNVGSVYDEENRGKVLSFISATTVWRTFESCNNYAMPDGICTDCPRIEYWFAQAEQRERRWDIRYIRKHFPQTVFRKFRGVGHGGLAALKPKILASKLESVMGEK